MKIIEVKYIKDYTINVKFDDGNEGEVNLDELIKKGIFQQIRDKTIFAKVYTTGYSIAWSEELEIDAIAVYLEITGKDIKEINQPHFFYASN